MAAEVVPQSNFWMYYDTFTQLISRIRSRTFSESDPCYARPDQTTFISNLPDEILLHIFQYLSQANLAKCERVCQSWLHVIRSGGSKLWHRADICYQGLRTRLRYEFSRQHPKRIRHLSDPQTGEILDPHKKLELYVQYLVQMKPRLLSMVISLDFLDERASKAIEFLISSGLCAELRDVRLRFIAEDRAMDSALYDEHMYDMSCLHFNHTLKHLVQHCPRITCLHTQLHVGFESLKWLQQLSTLQELDMVCVPRVALLMPWHLEKLLTKLTCLQTLRLQVTVSRSPYSATALSRFRLCSASLRHLDVSDCVNLVLAGLELPRLEEFRATDTKLYSAFRHTPDLPCLFEVLRAGCPSLRAVNGLPVTPHEAAHGMTPAKQRHLDICFCARRHAQP
jgi:hypothetical protein